MDHPNVIALRGILDTPLRVVMEFAPAGDLHQLIRRPLEDGSGRFEGQAKLLPWSFRYRLALDIALGMQYIAGQHLLHRDLRSPNIFLISRSPEEAPAYPAPIAKVADFGLSVFAMPKASGDLRTWRWLAPEVFHFSVREYGLASDIYSFGMVLWELIDGAFPFGEFNADEWEVQESIVKEGLRPTIGSCDPRYSSLIQKCWANSPKRRPSWTEIVEELVALAEVQAPEAAPLVKRPNIAMLQRDSRFTSFSISTASLTPTGQWEFPERIKAMVRVRDCIWLGNRAGEIIIWGPLPNGAEQARWKAHTSSILSLQTVSDSPDSLVVLSFGVGGTLSIWKAEAPYSPVKSILSIGNVTAVGRASFQGMATVWVALQPDTNGYPVLIYGSTNFQSSSLLLDPPENWDRKTLLASCVVDIVQCGS